ncbi:MAG: hypothetical protein RHS_3075 [Robinsoniella sp. RHS]|nr:MAG: hypothetical protein RHS_3075 [Robinsoniella sp. RHS]
MGLLAFLLSVPIGAEIIKWSIFTIETEFIIFFSYFYAKILTKMF